MLFSDHKSASDGDDLSGDVAGFVADEIADEAGDLFGVGVTVHWHVGVEHGVGLFAELFDHVCVHNTRRDGVDADAAVGDFLREGARERVDGAFGGAVGDFAAAGMAAPDGADVDDDAFLLGEHVRQHGARAVEGAVDVGVEQIEPFGVEHVLQESCPADASAVDQHIDAAPVVVHRVDNLLHLRWLAHIALHTDDIAAFGLEHAGEAVGGFNTFLINEADAVSFAGKSANIGSADPARTTGDENVSHESSLPFNHGLW